MAKSSSCQVSLPTDEPTHNSARDVAMPATHHYSHRPVVTTVERVHSELAKVRYPGFDRSIVAFGMVQNVGVHNADVVVTLALPTRKNDVITTLRSEIEAAVASIAGVERVEVQIAADVADSPRSTQQSATRQSIPGVDYILAVASGKGGVGKSTIAVSLALALRARGLRIGLLDADIHGPSVPLMTGTPDARPRMLEEKRIVPVERFGISFVSMGFFLDDRSPVIWRGPMVMSIVRQFLKDVVWGDLDVLVVDLPPGTGDAQLTLLQEVPVAGGVIVTTPQDMALQDVRRGISMFSTVQTPVLGIIENMSGYTCPRCGEHDPIFDTGGGQREAEGLGVRLLGTIPLLNDLRASMDRGLPLVVDDPTHPVSKTFTDIAAQVVALLHDEKLQPRIR